MSKVRKDKIASAKLSAPRLLKSYSANAIACELHPDFQDLTITDIHNEAPGINTYTLSLKNSKGGPFHTKAKPAYFSAGQYLSVSFDIGSVHVTRPFSISSSPSEAQDGYYKITIKQNPNGFVTDHISKNWEIGTHVRVSAPLGTFTYQRLRDARTVIGIAGGSGITPFHSMAKAIACGEEDFNLILLYGTRTMADAAFEEEFKRIEASCPKFRLINVLSDEKPPVVTEPVCDVSACGNLACDDSVSNGHVHADSVHADSACEIFASGDTEDTHAKKASLASKILGTITGKIKSEPQKDACARPALEYGFINAELIRKYAPVDGDYSIFLCGPRAMYDFADKEIEKLHIRSKFVRHEFFSGLKNPNPKNMYILTVKTGTDTWKVAANSDETLMVSMERTGIRVPSRCRSGLCGYCHSKLVSGEVYIPDEANGMRAADKKYGYIHPCAAFPLSDVTLIVPPAN